MGSESPQLNEKKKVRLGNYDVIAHIATGGMGVVYKAIDTVTGRDIALKVLTAEAASKPAMLERFRREAKNAAKLRHENIVTVYEFGEHKGTYFLSMEYVEGIDLHDYIDEQEMLDPEESRQIMVQAARALAHAHSHAIVHRDIKPSNFLLTRKGNRLIVKLTDLGLARETVSDEFRVTRAGTTVGTVDYISPEQARDSGLADVRSDMYSLGCTWFHMLTGRPPFDKGGLAERLIKHMEEPPPDVRTFNPRASDELVDILNKLLAKHPDDRYQDPQSLLQALVEMEPVRRVPLRKPSAKEARGIRKEAESSRKIKRRSDGSSSRKSARGQRSRTWMWIGAALAAAVVVGIPAFFLVRGKKSTADNSVVSGPPENARKIDLPPPRPNPPPVPPPVPPNPPPAKPRYPNKLYTPQQAVDAKSLRENYDKSWEPIAPVTPQTRVIAVNRFASGDNTARTLNEALARTAEQETTVLEIHDNGPLYLLSTSVVNRNVVIRAAKGRRPLIVWDVSSSFKQQQQGGVNPDGLFLFQLEQAALRLEGLELAVAWPANVMGKQDGVFDLLRSQLEMVECSLSASGTHEGLALVRCGGDGRNASRCRIADSYVRGTILTGFDFRVPGGTLLVEESLLVGGTHPFMQIRASSDRTSRVLMRHSTVITRGDLVQVTTPSETEKRPSIEWLMWDVLLTRRSSTREGTLLTLPGQVELNNMNWSAVNSLYVGWSTLLRGGLTLPASEMVHWRIQWDRTEGDVFKETLWPRTLFTSVEEKPASAYAVDDTDVAFASTESAEAPVGCPVEQLPPTRDNWLFLTYERFASAPLEPLFNSGPPPIPDIPDGKYHGGKINLDTPGFDLGSHLQQAGMVKGTGSLVVLHLSGTGKKTTSPIRMAKGTSLVLYFHQPPEAKDKLILQFAPRTTEVEGMIHLDEGNLDVYHGELHMGASSFARGVPYLLKVRHGVVRMLRTHLSAGPLAPAGLRALVTIEGIHQPQAEKPFGCALSESVLVSGKKGIEMIGTGIRLHLQDSLLATGEEAIELAPGKDVQPGAQVFCSLDRCTLGSRGKVFSIQEAEEAAFRTHPIMIQTTSCAFIQPFPKNEELPDVLIHAGGTTLERGQVIWQSEGDAFDGRWTRPLGSGAGSGHHPLKQEEWEAILGSPSFRKPTLDVQFLAAFVPGRWPLGELRTRPTIPPMPRKWGADLYQLGIITRN